MPVRALVPETSVSTNSTIRGFLKDIEKGVLCQGSPYGFRPRQGSGGGRYLDFGAFARSNWTVQVARSASRRSQTTVPS